MHECCPDHLRMGRARMKQDKNTEEKGKNRRVNMETDIIEYFLPVQRARKEVSTT